MRKRNSYCATVLMRKAMFAHTNRATALSHLRSISNFYSPECHIYICEANPRNHSPLPHFHSRRARTHLPSFLQSFQNTPPLFPSPQIPWRHLRASAAADPRRAQLRMAGRGLPRARPGSAAANGRELPLLPHRHDKETTLCDGTVAMDVASSFSV